MRNSSLSERKTSFTPFIERDESKIKEEMNKFKRRVAFEKKVK